MKSMFYSGMMRTTVLAIKSKELAIKSKKFVAIMLVFIVVVGLSLPIWAAEEKSIIYGVLGDNGTLAGAYQVDVTKKDGKNEYSEKSLDPNQYDLPWRFEQSYRLDGKTMLEQQLAGQSGYFEIDLDIYPRDKQEGDLAKHYMLQVVVSFPAEGVRGVVAPDATLAYKGNQLQAVYLLLPGESHRLRLAAEVEHLELEPILISALPVNVGMEVPNAKESRVQLADLMSGVSALSKGTTGLKKGLEQATNGAKKLNLSQNQLRTGFFELKNGSADLVVASEKLATGLSALGVQLADAHRNQETSSNQLSALMGSNSKAIGQYEAQLGSLAAEHPQVAGLKGSIELLLANQQALMGIEKQSGALIETGEVIAKLSEGADGLVQGTRALNGGLGEVNTGLEAFMKGFGQFYRGLVSLSNASEDLSVGANSLDGEIGDASSELYSLLDKLERLEPLAENQGGTQFVIRTQGIYLDKVKGVETSESVPTFWQKLMLLFK